MKTYLTEIMSSVQGEGTRIGCRQIFVRFALCNLKCHYCDTQSRLHNTAVCQVEKEPGSGIIENYQNPISPEELIDIISQYNLSCHHSVSFTGGEPLLYIDYLKTFIPMLIDKAPGLKIFLETNGTLTEQLKEILDLTDIISMDFKIPSTSWLEPLWDTHRNFLQLAKAREVYVKAVVSEATTEKEIQTVANIIKETGQTIPLILQPLTTKEAMQGIGIKPAKLLALQEKALEITKDVRVIPQTHLYMGLL